MVLNNWTVLWLIDHLYLLLVSSCILKTTVVSLWRSACSRLQTPVQSVHLSCNVSHLSIQRPVAVSRCTMAQSRRNTPRLWSTTRRRRIKPWDSSSQPYRHWSSSTCSTNETSSGKPSTAASKYQWTTHLWLDELHQVKCIKIALFKCTLFQSRKSWCSCLILISLCLIVAFSRLELNSNIFYICWQNRKSGNWYIVYIALCKCTVCVSIKLVRIYTRL